MRTWISLSACLAVLVCIAPPATAQQGESSADLNGLLEGYRRLELGAAGTSVQGRALSLGHLHLTLSDGAVWPLRSAGGDVLGFYFQGHGNYRYTSQDPGDLQVLAVNLGRNAPHLKPSQGTVSDRFERMVLFAAAPLFPELGLESASGVPAGGDERSGFARIWGRIGQTYLEYDHLAAVARLNGGGAQYVYAEIEGQGEIVGYTYDRVSSLDESLTSFRKFQGYDFRFPQLLSQQPIAGANLGTVRVNLRDVRLDVSTEDNKSARIKSDLTLEVAREGVRVVSLELVNNVDTVHANWASPKHALRVVKVQDGSGAALPFSHRYHELLVQFPRAYGKGETIVLHVEAEGDVLTAMDGERNDNYFELFTVSWFPRPPLLGTSAYTFAIKARTRKPYLPVASGTTASFREDGDFYELETRSTVPSRYLAVFAGKYKVREEVFDGLTVRVHAYATARKVVMENLPKLANDLVGFYRQALGPPPVDELDLVEVPALGFGIAPAGMVLLTTEAYQPRQDWLTGYYSRGINSRLAHEIAHQWFGHKVMPASGRDWWLGESFAEYLAGLAMAAAAPDERHVAGFKRMLAEWQATTKECAGQPMAQATQLGGVEGSEDGWCLLYNKGPLILHMFRTTVGDQAFFAVLRRMLDDVNGEPADLDDLKGAARQTLKNDMTWFFDQWFGQGGIPEIRVTHALDSASGGGVVLRGRVEQAAGPAFKKMVIPLVVEYGDGRREAKVLLQETPVQEFRFELPQRPRKVTVDPSQNNLAVYR